MHMYIYRTCSCVNFSVETWLTNNPTYLNKKTKMNEESEKNINLRVVNEINIF